jgi:hypothetical protein
VGFNNVLTLAAAAGWADTHLHGLPCRRWTVSQVVAEANGIHSACVAA